MAHQTTCPREGCKSTLFESVANSAIVPGTTIRFVQCAKCGYPITAIDEQPMLKQTVRNIAAKVGAHSEL